MAHPLEAFREQMKASDVVTISTPAEDIGPVGGCHRSTVSFVWGGGGGDCGRRS